MDKIIMEEEDMQCAGGCRVQKGLEAAINYLIIKDDIEAKEADFKRHEAYIDGLYPKDNSDYWAMERAKAMARAKGDKPESKNENFSECDTCECDNSARNDCEAVQATSKQEGGSHYLMPIQPAEFIQKNGLSFLEGNVIKYVCRHGKKNGVEDINKAIHYLELIKAHVYDDY